MTPWSEMSLYLYQRSPTRPGTAAGAEARAHDWVGVRGWGDLASGARRLSRGAPRPRCAAGRSPVRRRRPPLLGASATARLGRPPRVRPRGFKYADRGRRGGGGRGRRREEGGRERSGERRGEPQPRALGD